MSTVITYLTLVKTYDDEDSSVHSTTLEEDAQMFEVVKSMGVQAGMWRGERHLLIPLLAPLTREQVQSLTEIKEAGWISNFYVKDEISH